MSMTHCDICGEAWVHHDTACASRDDAHSLQRPCSARADAIIKDILDNHLPRVIEGLKVGYVDENQILVIYDHAVRARIMKENAQNDD